MFICTDSDNYSYIGKTLQECYKNAKDSIDFDDINELHFYEAKEIKVQIKIEAVPITIITKKGK